MTTTEEMNRSEMVILAKKLEEVRKKEGWIREDDPFCETLAMLGMLHSKMMVRSRQQMELKFQEAAVEVYVQRRESDEIFYNWVDDI